MESSDQGKIKHQAASKGGLALGVSLLYTVFGSLLYSSDCLTQLERRLLLRVSIFRSFQLSPEQPVQVGTKAGAPSRAVRAKQANEPPGLGKEQNFVELSWEKLFSLPGTHPCTTGKHQQEK